MKKIFALVLASVSLALCLTGNNKAVILNTFLYFFPHKSKSVTVGRNEV